MEKERKIPEIPYLEQPYEIEGPPKEARESFYALAKNRIKYLTHEEFIKWNQDDIKDRNVYLSPAINIIDADVYKDVYKEEDNLEKWVNRLEIAIDKDAFKINEKDYSDVMPFVAEHEIYEDWLRAKKGVGSTFDRKKQHILAQRRAFLLAEQRSLGDKFLEWAKLIAPNNTQHIKQCEYALKVAKKQVGHLKKFEKSKEDREIREKSQKRRKEASHTTIQDRGLKAYQKELRIPITKEFLGEKVLDLGSGKTARFAREAAKRGIQVYSLNPDLYYEKYRYLLKKGSEKDIKKLFAAGLAQELPFKSDAFDSVLSMWAVPYYVEKNQEEQETALREIIRVLKPGGKAFLSPVYEERVPFVEEAIKKIRNEKLADLELLENPDGVSFEVIIIKAKEK